MARYPKNQISLLFTDLECAVRYTSNTWQLHQYLFTYAWPHLLYHLQNGVWHHKFYY